MKQENITGRNLENGDICTPRQQQKTKKQQHHQHRNKLKIQKGQQVCSHLIKLNNKSK